MARGFPVCLVAAFLATFVAAFLKTFLTTFLARLLQALKAAAPGCLLPIPHLPQPTSPCVATARRVPVFAGKRGNDEAIIGESRQIQGKVRQIGQNRGSPIALAASWWY